MIKTTIVGHIGSDCNLNTVNGRNVINFSVAHSEKFKDAQGNNREKTLWVNCAYWTDKTGIAPYLKKGTLVYAEGTPDISVYTDKSGKPQAEFKLRVNQVQLLGGNKENQNGSQQQQYTQRLQQTTDEITDSEDRLPF